VISFEGKEPLDKTRNWFSIITFSWLRALISLSKRQGALYLCDVHPPKPAHEPRNAGAEFVRAWNASLARKMAAAQRRAAKSARSTNYAPTPLTPLTTPSVIKVAFSAYKKPIIVALCCIPFYVLSYIATPIAIQEMTSILHPAEVMRLRRDNCTSVDGSTTCDYGAIYNSLFSSGWWRLLLVFLGQFVFAFTDAVATSQLYDASVRSMSGLLDVMYQKLLTLSDISRQTAGSNLNNLIAADSQRIAYFLQLLATLLVIPLQLVVVIIYILVQIHYTAIGGLIGLLITLPIIGACVSYISTAMKRLMNFRDERVRRCTEILTGIQIVKMLCMEDVQLARVRTSRQKETRAISTFGVVMSVMSTCANASGSLCTLFCFLFLHLVDRFDPIWAFTAFYLFNLVGVAMMVLPMSLSSLAECRVSAARIACFLSLPERDPLVLVRHEAQNGSEHQDGKCIPALSVTGLPSFCWGLDSDTTVPDILDPFFKVNEGKRKVLRRNYQKYLAEYASLRSKFLEACPHMQGVDEQVVKLISEGPEKPLASTAVIDRWAVELGLPLCSTLDNITNYSPEKYAAQDGDSLYDRVRKAFLHLVVVQPFYTALKEADKAKEGSRRGSPASEDAANEANTANAANTANTASGIETTAAVRHFDLSIAPGELVGLVGKVGSGKTSLFTSLLGELRLVPELRSDIDLWTQKCDGVILDTQGRLLRQEGPVGNRRGARCMYFDYDVPAPKLTDYPRPPEHIPHIEINGSVAYYSQGTSIYSGTVRDNICFFQPYEEEKYRHIVDLCCLQPDFELFANGDLTELGEKGANLSGGQRARIAFARAVYSDSDILLLDDPLSAVDAHVGAKLWRECICGYLRQRGTTVLISSHQTQYFSDCDRVLVIDGGSLVHDGAPSALAEEGVLGIPRSRTESTQSISTLGAEQGRLVTTSVTESSKVARESGSGSAHGVPPPEARRFSADAQHKREEQGKTIADEDLGSGSISGAAYKAWFKSGGAGYVAALVIFTVAWQAVYQYSSIFLRDWLFSSFSGAEFGSNMGIYTGVVLGSLVLQFLGTFMGIQFIISASKTLHMRMVDAILHTHIRFFDTTPSGRIINRLTKDTDSADANIMRYMSQAISCFASLVGMLVTICILSYPALLAVVPCAIVYWAIFQSFRRVTPQVKRLDSITRSFVFSCTQEAGSSLPVIRAYARERSFIEKYRRSVSVNVAAYNYSICLQRWLAFRLNVLGGAFAFLVSLVAILMAPLGDGSMSASAGLIISYGFSCSQLMNQFVISTTQAEAELASVERIVEYCNLEREGAKTRDKEGLEQRSGHSGSLGSRNRSGSSATTLSLSTGNGAPAIPPGWPAKGKAGLSFRSLNFRYRPELDLTLHDVEFTIAPGERVGVVGRTGAGKSSLTVAMFRLAEPDPGSHIYIDGVDILNDVGIYQARRAMSIIPQQPFLFSGTLRCSLCPYSQAKAEGAEPPAGTERVPDDVLWAALEQVNLRPYFERQPGGLDCKIAIGGENLSAGQRQLVCVARALVRNAAVIVLDEATACVDKEGDKQINDAIRHALTGVTVFSIAHRLDTIIDFDKVLVMDAGRVAEYDTPANLLRKQDSIFSSLVDKTGEEESARLRELAFAAETARKGVSKAPASV